MAIKLAELSTARAALVVAAAVVEAVGRGLAVAVAAVAIYRLVYFYGPLYGTNTY
jgi:hypothetical protein